MAAVSSGSLSDFVKDLGKVVGPNGKLTPNHQYECIACAARNPGNSGKARFKGSVQRAMHHACLQTGGGIAICPCGSEYSPEQRSAARALWADYSVSLKAKQDSRRSEARQSDK